MSPSSKLHNVHMHKFSHTLANSLHSFKLRVYHVYCRSLIFLKCSLDEAIIDCHQQFGKMLHTKYKSSEFQSPENMLPRKYIKLLHDTELLKSATSNV